MNKTNYIIRQIAKSHSKKYENYVITRIWHLLNNSAIKIVTQQHIIRPDGRALTDLYFPQIDLHIEIDEGQHFTKDGQQTNDDVARDADIINATGHQIERIKVFDQTIEQINSQIDILLSCIQEKISIGLNFVWDIDAEYKPETYIKKGFISACENIGFKTIADACNCFGHSYSGFQRGFTKHKIEDRMLWFPKLYENQYWKNSISPDETKIFESRVDNPCEHVKESIFNENMLKERLVFAHAKNNLGETLYRFKGVFRLNPQSSNETTIVYDRIDSKVKTYSP
ncbi:MAG: hypothetical protein WAU37_01455 [Formosimonas sp.]